MFFIVMQHHPALFRDSLHLTCYEDVSKWIVHSKRVWPRNSFSRVEPASSVSSI